MSISAATSAWRALSRFLDDITLEELGRALGCRAVSIPTDGGGCCKAMLSTHKRKTIKFKR